MGNAEQQRVQQIIEDRVIGGREHSFDHLNKTIQPVDYHDPDEPKLPVTGADLGHSTVRGGQYYDQLLG